MDKRINILGAGGHAKVIIEIAELLNYSIDGVYDQNENVKEILKYPVLHDLKNLSTQENVFFALGSNYNREKNSHHFQSADFNLVHPSAVCSKYIDWGKGNAVMAGAVINPSVKIGDFCIINTSSSIDHDCEIENYVHISPNSSLAGNVKVKEGAQIGIGACVKQDVTIGRWSIVGAGAVVLQDVPDHVIVVGNPARIIKSLL